MCDFSLYHVKSRPAKLGDRLTTRDFGLGTRGFAASEDKYIAVCLLPGTELSFADEVRRVHLWPWSRSVINDTTAIFGPTPHAVIMLLMTHALLYLEDTDSKSNKRPKQKYGVNNNTKLEDPGETVEQSYNPEYD